MSMLNIGAILPVGTIIHSMLTTTQFASQYGDNWVIADGRTVTGSLYASVTGISSIPDLRGGFLRAKGATLNPDGDLALGTLTADKTRLAVYFSAPPASSFGAAATQDSTVSSTFPNRYNNETAPVSVTVNVFIRIN